VPTRTRYVLKTKNGEIYTGKNAVSMVCSRMSAVALTVDLPLGWKQLSTPEKLAVIAKHLPKGTTLMIFKEPRYCRKNKSLYLRAIKAREVPGVRVLGRPDEEFPPAMAPVARWIDADIFNELPPNIPPRPAVPVNAAGQRLVPRRRVLLGGNNNAI
jgi:hypothetical protein